MLKRLHEQKPVQLGLGLIMGILFGFFLQRGQATRYDIILGQMLLRDFTVMKIMMTAAVVGMIGIYTMRRKGMAQLHPKEGAVGSTVIGSLIFGSGMAILGYCPGTTLGAVGQGSMDALAGGLPGMLVGAIIYSSLYPSLSEKILQKGDFGKATFPDYFKVTPLVAIGGFYMTIITVFFVLEISGF
ncbi:MAG: YeeE/YedE thiosulfate transporter family protein [Thermodesulfobacteriota bacterium]